MARMIAATIRGGVAVSDDFADLPDGTPVTVTLGPLDDDFVLTPELEASLEAASAQIARGEYITADEMRRRLDARRSKPRS